MTVTHGTRSTYNRGCRCDACREASREARARQRSVVRGEQGSPPTRPAKTWSSEASNPYVATPTTDHEVAPVGFPATAIGAVLVGAGAFCLWHGWRMRPGPDAEDPGRAWATWCVSGAVLVVAGAAVLVVHHRSEAQ
jgi:hypothetical protein